MKRYRTEISIKILGPVLAVFALTIFLVYKEAGYVHEILILLGAVLVFSLYIIYGIWYEISDNQFLKVRAGIFYKIDVPIDKIHTIEKTNSILSAPASSMNRIEVKYNKFDSVVISPQHREMFIQDLLNINPNINVKL